MTPEARCEGSSLSLVRAVPEEEAFEGRQVDSLEHAVVRVEMEDIVRRVESRGIVDGQRRDVGLDAERGAGRSLSLASTLMRVSRRCLS